MGDQRELAARLRDAASSPDDIRAIADALEAGTFGAEAEAPAVESDTEQPPPTNVGGETQDAKQV